MAGGKETPRQKMIGMMYLVLTALLALNVSKSILDAFVAIEENMQISNENEFARGEEKRKQLEEQAIHGEEPARKQWANLQFNAVKAIDRETEQLIAFTDELKKEILVSCGENTEVGKQHILLEKKSSHYPLKPVRMNLTMVDAKDKYDEPMHILIGDDIKRPTGKGLDLWKKIIVYREKITQILSESANEGKSKKYGIRFKAINDHKNYKELQQRVEKELDKASIHPDDREILAKLYIGLTKQERVDMGETKDVHWIGKTFDHAPVVAAIASLTSIQNEVLTARADAIAHIRSRVGGSEYAFNRVLPLAYGPELVNSGDEVEVRVLMAAYDSYATPEVQAEQGSLTGVKDGMGTLRWKANKTGESKLKGTISIRNKRGEKKTMNWEKVIRVMQPSGTITLTEMNRLYRGHENPISAVASGFEETQLRAGGNVKLRKTASGWIAEPEQGRTCTISVVGVDKKNNRQVTLGTYTYEVSNLPTPELYWGNVKNGGSLNYFGNGIFPKYPPEIPLKAGFQILSMEISSSTIGTHHVTGSKIPADLEKKLKQTKPNEVVQIIAKVKPTKGNAPVSLAFGSWKRN